MKSVNFALICVLGFAGTALAQVPSTNDTSTTDSHYNTGMGTGALGGPAATNGGGWNTASGYQALGSNTTGGGNTASGYVALGSNTTGGGNTATGFEALYSNTTGSGNTASGDSALVSNTTGINNTASGYGTLGANTTGGNDTASGFNALAFNTSGSNNTASGYAALELNTTGENNTASGYAALQSNTTGDNNTASGFSALGANTTGDNNTATGTNALYSNHNGDFNTAAGQAALHNNTSGNTNTALGYQAGYNLTTGSHNIDIGNLGVSAESGIIRIGTAPANTAVYMAGIESTKLTGSAVYITSAGQLGVLASSERFKTAIEPMGSNTVKLSQLRPVTFHLKTDPKGALQYGLIAEEVAKVYPELVIRGNSGRIDGVRYDELVSMLLNEMQKRNAAQDARIRDLEQQIVDMHAVLQMLRGKEGAVAQR